MRLDQKCEFCGKLAKEASRSILDGMTAIELVCGHSILEETFTTKDNEIPKEIVFEDGRKFYPFQKMTHEFLKRANFRGLCLNDMGLGKTINAVAPIFTDPEITLPALFLCKSSLTVQTMKQIYSLTGILPQVIQSGQDIPFPNTKVFIVGFDMLHRLKWIKDFPFKYVVLDEVQLLKNPNAKRTNAVQDVVRDKTHVQGFSGTPIKNHAGEYWTILNIMNPLAFPTYAGYVKEFCEIEYSGRVPKIGGLRRDRIDRFQEITKDFIIRFTREEAMPELPPIIRDYKIFPLAKEVEAAYQSYMNEFMEEFGEVDEGSYAKNAMNILAYLTRMRHITGISKVNDTVDQAFDFLNNFPEEKITLFAHHHQVVDLLEIKLSEICKNNGWKKPIVLRASDPPGKESLFVDDKDSRVLIASMLSKGEGLNLQVCRNVIMVERQWNPANEEQAEKRFSRIGSTEIFGNDSKVFATYIIAEGTIDEFFAELVSRKRERVERTIDGEATDWKEDSLMKDLFFRVQSEGRKLWGKR